VVEWADRWPDILPERIIEVRLTVLNADSREVFLAGRHPRSVGVIEALRESWNKG
jgi:hypothetical protein